MQPEHCCHYCNGEWGHTHTDTHVLYTRKGEKLPSFYFRHGNRIRSLELAGAAQMSLCVSGEIFADVIIKFIIEIEDTFIAYAFSLGRLTLFVQHQGGIKERAIDRDRENGRYGGWVIKVTTTHRTDNLSIHWNNISNLCFLYLYTTTTNAAETEKP